MPGGPQQGFCPGRPGPDIVAVGLRDYVDHSCTTYVIILSKKLGTVYTGSTLLCGVLSRIST